MAITSIDGVLAGQQPIRSFLKVFPALTITGYMSSLFYSPGVPGPAIAPTPGLAGEALTTYAGQIPYTNPSSGNAYLSYLRINCMSAGAAFLLTDRLWHNSGIVVTTTGAQTINSVAWPARDRDGSTNGENVMVGLEVSTATTNAAAIFNTTISYTNSAGTAGRTGTFQQYGSPFPANALAGNFTPFLLDSGDTGIRSIQSLTLGTSYVTGTIHLVAYRWIVCAEVMSGVGGIGLDAVTGGMPRLYDNTVPFFLWTGQYTGGVMNGQIAVTHG